MKIKYIFCVFLTLHLMFFKSQSSSFIYELNYKPNTDSLKTEKIIFYLDVKNNESVFRSDKFRQSDSIRIKSGYGEGYDPAYNNKQLYIYKNHVNKKVQKYIFVPFIDATYTIAIQDKPKWRITDEKQIIGKFNCQKAETEYGGRKWLAWFTNDIPIQDGPYVFYGLPGLIIKIADDRNDYNFQLGEIRQFNWKQLGVIKSQREISWNEFQKLQKDFYSDPLSNTNRSDITHYDESGNVIKNNYKEMIKVLQNRILKKNNPIELNYKVEYQ